MKILVTGGGELFHAGAPFSIENAKFLPVLAFFGHFVTHLWCPFTSQIVWWCPKIDKYEVCPGQWQILLLCSLVFVMEQLSRAINYLERCQSYFLTSSICAIANQCMVENSLFLRSVFRHKTHLIKNK